MSDIESIGKLLLVFGGVLVLVGILLVVFGKVPYVGRLPGDILLNKGNFRFYAPLMTMILLSLLLSLVANVLLRLFR